MSEKRAEKSKRAPAPMPKSALTVTQTTFVPFKLRKRGVASRVVFPDAAAMDACAMQVRNNSSTPLQRRLGRAFRWLAQLQAGAMPSVKAIAAAEGLDRSYVSRVLGLTVRSPEIIADILDDTISSGGSVYELAVNQPLCWSHRRNSK